MTPQFRYNKPFNSAYWSQMRTKSINSLSSTSDNNNNNNSDEFAIQLTSVQDIELGMELMEPVECNNLPTTNNIINTSHTDIITNHTWIEDIYTLPFLYIFIFGSIQMFRTNMYFGLIKLLLQQLYDNNDNFIYTQIFIGGLPCSFIFIYMIEYSYKKVHLKGVLYLVILFGYIYGIVSCIPILSIQIISFIMFYMFRAYLYSVMGIYFSTYFAVSNQGMNICIIVYL